MPLSLKEKQAVVAEVSEVARAALSAAIADNKGLSSNELNELRARARDSQIVLRVVKNSLAKRALEGTEFQVVESILTGPSVLAFSAEDPGAPARLFKDFIKEHEKLEVKGLALGGQLLDASKLSDVASLPTYDEAVASLMSVMKAPIAQFVRTLAEPYAMLVRTVAAVADQKKAA